MSFVKYCKLVISGILGMLDIPVKNECINLRKTFMFPSMQRINAILNFPLEISQRFSKFFLGTLDRPGETHKSHKKDSINFQKLLMLISTQKSTSSPLLSWYITRTLYFRYDWLHPWDMIVTFWVLWYLSVQKPALFFTSFSRHCKDFVNLLF